MAQGVQDVQFPVDVPPFGFEAYAFLGEELFYYSGAFFRRCLEAGKQLTDRGGAQACGEEVLDHHDPLDHRFVEVAPAAVGP